MSTKDLTACTTVDQLLPIVEGIRPQGEAEHILFELAKHYTQEAIKHEQEAEKNRTDGPRWAFDHQLSSQHFSVAKAYIYAIFIYREHSHE